MVNSVSNNSLSQTQGFARRLQNQLSELASGKQAQPAVLTQNSNPSSKFDLASGSQGSGGVQGSSQAAPPPGNVPRGSIVDVLV